MQSGHVSGKGRMDEMDNGEKKKIPVGIENFKKLCTEDFYYVDKTAMIREMIREGKKINLFTRPRRFGKSLNMSMLKAFFEIGCDPALFEGLAISIEKEMCRWQKQTKITIMVRWLLWSGISLSRH